MIPQFQTQSVNESYCPIRDRPINDKLKSAHVVPYLAVRLMRKHPVNHCLKSHVIFHQMHDSVIIAAPLHKGHVAYAPTWYM